MLSELRLGVGGAEIWGKGCMYYFFFHFFLYSFFVFVVVLYCFIFSIYVF